MKTTLFSTATFAAAAVALASANRAGAEIVIFTTFMDGPSEAPPNASPGTGTATLTYDTVARTMRVEADFINLIGTTTVCHIHGPTAVPFDGTAGVMTTTPTFPGFPAGVTAGTYDVTFDMLLASSYNPAFVTANGGSIAATQEAFFAALVQGRAYFNVHSTFAPGGEIRGFFVPAPSAAAVMGLGGLLVLRRRRGT